jgi:two-component system nitrogen regulation sensor histidine kinase GlnL
MQQEQGVLDNISTGIIALDAQLCVLAMNASGQALLELSESRYLGSHARQLLLQPEHLLQSLQQVLRERSPLSQRGMSLILLGGQEIHVDMMITPVGENNGDIAMLVEIQPVDRLLKISREEGLVHSQETTRAVIRGLAHEIKNPLGGVRGAAQLLDRELPDKSLTEYTQVISSIFTRSWSTCAT